MLACVHVCMRAYVRTYVHMCMHACVRMCVHVHVHAACVRAYVHACVYVHARAHAYDVRLCMSMHVRTSMRARMHLPLEDLVARIELSSHRLVGFLLRKKNRREGLWLV